MQFEEYELLLTGQTGRGGAKKAFQEQREHLMRVLSPSMREFFLKDREDVAKETRRLIDRVLKETVDVYAEPVIEGGIYAALWRLAARLSCGLSVVSEDIPVCQEAVELGELLRHDPYTWEGGADVVLIAAKDARQLAGRLQERGVHAALIGCLKDGSDKILWQQGRKRYLDRPRQEEA